MFHCKSVNKLQPSSGPRGTTFNLEQHFEIYHQSSMKDMEIEIVCGIKKLVWRHHCGLNRS